MTLLARLLVSSIVCSIDCSELFLVSRLLRLLVACDWSFGCCFFCFFCFLFFLFCFFLFFFCFVLILFGYALVLSSCSRFSCSFHMTPKFKRMPSQMCYRVRRGGERGQSARAARRCR